MPLDAQDKLLQEELARLFLIASRTGEIGTGGTGHLRERLSRNGSELAWVLLELIPPNSAGRSEALDHLKRVAVLTSVALAGTERLERVL